MYVALIYERNGFWRRSGEFGGMEHEGLSDAVSTAHQWQVEHPQFKLVCLIDLDTYLDQRTEHQDKGLTTNELVKQYILPRDDCVLFDGAPAIDGAKAQAQAKAGKPRRDPDHSPFWWDLRDKSGNLKVSPDAVWAAVVASSKSCN